ncbi:MAG TPA: hypothetical protein VEL76_16025 [Gemmataceae bacterium]|nr:hypothetical protein [Gemmataceae bacterium]
MQTTNGLGLTGVFVARPHARPGPAEHRIGDLAQLVSLVRG